MDSKVIQVPRDLLGQMAHLVLKGRKAYKAYKALLVLQDQQGQPDLQEQRAIQVLRGQKAILVLFLYQPH
jgi:hypothetical protein